MLWNIKTNSLESSAVIDDKSGSDDLFTEQQDDTEEGIGS